MAKLQELRDQSLMARLNYEEKAAYEKMIDPRACVLYNGKPVKAKCPKPWLLGPRRGHRGRDTARSERSTDADAIRRRQEGERIYDEVRSRGEYPKVNKIMQSSDSNRPDK